MKLIFKEKYLSIEEFKQIDLTDFTVLTGVNGSGKSHLLGSIQQKKSIIDGLINPKIVYFNYETFKLEEETIWAAHQISNEAENAWKLFNEQIKNNITSWENQFLGNNCDKLHDICVKKDKELWFLSAEDIVDESLIESLEKYKKSITNYFNSDSLRGNHQAQAILMLIKKIKFCICAIEKDDFISMYKPYIFKSDFLPQQLGRIVWSYYVKFRDNQTNLVQNEKYNKSYPAIPENDFIIKYGAKPWEVINKIFEKFDSLDYVINSPEGSGSTDSFQLRLLHKLKKLEIGFENLSSGERVLMALVASIYKSSSDKHFPDLLLLDEIDASLHPSMINNLLEVIKDIFLQKKVKVILVTHSPTTIALSPEESIFVMNKGGENRIEKRTKEEALSILTEGFASLSQNESDLSIAYSISKASGAVIFTEGITDKIILETAWEKLYTTEMPFYVQDCFCASMLKNFLNRGGDQPDGFFCKYHDKKFIALFDFDKEGYENWNNLNFSYHEEQDPRKGLTRKHPSFSASAILLPVPTSLESQVIDEGNITFKDGAHLTIELMFYGVDSLEGHFRDKKTSSGKLMEFIGDKRKFSENCRNFPKEYFNNFKVLFKNINSILEV